MDRGNESEEFDSMVKMNPLPRSNSQSEEERDVKADKMRTTVEDLWKCSRLNTEKKNSLQGIPLGEEQQRRWIQARKEERHLELDFLSKDLVYNHAAEIHESNQLMERVLKQIGNDKIDSLDNNLLETAQFAIRESIVSNRSTYSKNLFNKARIGKD